jgi:2-methylcitrate dehydratase PrpD
MKSARMFSHEFANKIVAGPPNDLPNACYDWAIKAIIDTLGVALAGAATDTARIVARTAPLAPGPCHVIGGTQTCDPLNAALLNGTAAHALDYDDMTQNMMGHPSVALLPPLFALGEYLQTSGEELVRAYLIGFETVCKLGRAVTYAHHDKGWHGTATLGTFGAVAACCSLMKLDTNTTATALSMACSMASGLRANFGTMTKPLHAGHAGRNAIFATLSAQNGFTANEGAFEGKQGFFEVFLGHDIAEPELALADWYDPPEILDPGVCLKLYPSGAHTHPFIEMVRALVRDHALTLDMIDSIDVLAEQSRHDHINRPILRAGLEGKWSVQYVIARTLIDGAPRLEHFTDTAVKEAQILDAMKKVHAAPHPELDASWADKYGGEVIITTTKGDRHRARIEHQIARGPDKPLSDEDLKGKFLDCARLSLLDNQAEKLFLALQNFRNAENVSALLSKTQPDTSY